ncbi:MAG: type II toxin-antitoxin system VapC family toxin [Hyphomicrobiales bacterium]
MFIDASAIVAIIAREPDHEDLEQRLKRHRRRAISAIAAYEATLALARLRNLTLSEAQDIVLQFKNLYAISETPIEFRLAATALDAFNRFGKGRGHKAALNLGDCFSYACARQLKVPLLFKGGDFVHTDIQQA